MDRSGSVEEGIFFRLRFSCRLSSFSRIGNLGGAGNIAGSPVYVREFLLRANKKENCRVPRPVQRNFELHARPQPSSQPPLVRPAGDIAGRDGQAMFEKNSAPRRSDDGRSRGRLRSDPSPKLLRIRRGTRRLAFASPQTALPNVNRQARCVHSADRFPYTSPESLIGKKTATENNLLFLKLKLSRSH
jgi:hypothetical protein